MNNELFVKDTVEGFKSIRAELQYGEVGNAITKIEEYLESMAKLGIDVGDEYGEQ